MNDNQTKKLIKLESLDNIQIEDKQQELSLEEVSLIQGGLLLTPSESSPGKPELIKLDYPWPINLCRYLDPMGTDRKLPPCFVIL